MKKELLFWLLIKQHRVSNTIFNISNGACQPVLNERAPVYINIGDGGNSEGIAGE